MKRNNFNDKFSYYLFWCWVEKIKNILWKDKNKTNGGIKMKTEEIKPNWLITGGVGITLLLIILASVANPLLIYLALIVVGFVSIANMVRIERIILEKKKELEVEEPEMDEPAEPPFSEEIEKARSYLKEGFTKEEIAAGLREKHGNAEVDYIIKQMEV